MKAPRELDLIVDQVFGYRPKRKRKSKKRNRDARESSN